MNSPSTETEQLGANVAPDEEAMKKSSTVDLNKSSHNLAPFSVFPNPSKVLQPSSANNQSRMRHTSTSNPYSAFANRIQMLRGPSSKQAVAKPHDSITRVSRTPEPQAAQPTETTAIRDENLSKSATDQLDLEVVKEVVHDSIPKAGSAEQDTDTAVPEPKSVPEVPFSPTRPPSSPLENEPTNFEEPQRPANGEDVDTSMNVYEEKLDTIEVSDESRASTPQKRKRSPEPETRASSPVPVTTSSLVAFASLPEAQVVSSNPYPEDDFDLEPNSSQPATQTQTETQDTYDGDDSKSLTGHERVTKRRKYYEAMDTVLMKALSDKKRAGLKLGQMERLSKKKDDELRELQARVEALEKEKQQANEQLGEKSEECIRLKEEIQQVTSQKEEAKGLFSQFASEIQRAFGS